MKLINDRFRAFTIHLFFSALITGFFLLIVYFIWYPFPLYITEDLSKITLIFLGSVLIIGPVLTLIVYKKGKKYLWLDLTIIITIQLSAFLYGATIFANARPVYIVFAVDVFKTISPAVIDLNSLKDQTLKYSLFSKPIYIYATAPSDPKKRTELMWHTLSGGKDIEQLPEYYQSYKKNLPLVIKKQIHYTKLFKNNPDLRIKINRLLNKEEYTLNNTAALPFFRKNKNSIVIINKHNGKIIGYFDNIR